MLILSLKELRLIAKNRNINGYQSMLKYKLFGIIDNKKGDRKSLLNQKKKKTKKVFISQQKTVFLNYKEKKLRKDFTSQQKRIFLNQT